MTTMCIHLNHMRDISARTNGCEDKVLSSTFFMAFTDKTEETPTHVVPEQRAAKYHSLLAVTDCNRCKRWRRPIRPCSLFRAEIRASHGSADQDDFG
jgi:hypothetical protein